MGMSPRAPGGSKTNLEYMGALTQNSGTVGRAMQDQTTVYSSYLNKNVQAKPSAVAWEIKDCTKGDTTITIQCPGYVFLAFFVYGV